MSALGYVWLAVAVAFIASAVVVVWLADRAPAGEPDRSRLDDWHEEAQAREHVRRLVAERPPCITPADVRADIDRLADDLIRELELQPRARRAS